VYICVFQVVELGLCVGRCVCSSLSVVTLQDEDFRGTKHCNSLLCHFRLPPRYCISVFVIEFAYMSVRTDRQTIMHIPFLLYAHTIFVIFLNTLFVETNVIKMYLT